PLADVYRVMTNPDEQRHWWPSMQVAHTAARPDHQPGGTVVYHVQQASSVARFVRPFVITSVTEDVEPERRTRSVVSGDLIGVLETLFAARPDGGTQIRYHWYVRVRNPLFNLAGFFAAPMFRASHDHVMDEGEAGLNRYMRAQIGVRAGA
nr:SRPBCC family protein [Ktedonobacterales bacterium]